MTMTADMARTLDGRVAIITGAGRGLGREHALLFAREGAHVVVNDRGGSSDGAGADASPADAVVEEIRAGGGQATANHDDITTWDGARNLVEQAVDTFGDLHVLVNNAGIIRDRMLFGMSEDEWDAVIEVHLKGHFCPTHFAADYWRARAKDGEESDRAIVNTTSTAGIFGSAGQLNYATAKMGLTGFTFTAAKELARYHVRVNAIAPIAATRLTETIGLDQSVEPSQRFEPGDVSPFVGYLATERCPMTGRIFYVARGEVMLFQPFTVATKISMSGRWTVQELERAAGALAEHEIVEANPFEL